MGKPGQDEPIPITDLPPSVAQSQRPRIRQYVIQMSIRVVCFILALIFDGWLRWGFFIAAAILPYVAVIIANAGPTNFPTTSGRESAQLSIEGKDRDDGES